MYTTYRRPTHNTYVEFYKSSCLVLMHYDEINGFTIDRSLILSEKPFTYSHNLIINFKNVPLKEIQFITQVKETIIYY